jgi:hypothetical protein
MAKRGRAKSLAKTCGGGCLGLNLGLYLAAGGKGIDPETNEEYTIPVAQFLASAAIWSALFAGGGYLVGMVTDDWQVVYVATD